MPHELAPSGVLRAGLAAAPAVSALFVVKEPDAKPRGVTADLSQDLARSLGLPLEFLIAPNTGELTDALEAGRIDVAFMPVDDERRKRIAFGPVYFLVESTYMVTGASGIRTVAEVDRPGVRVVGIANTTTIRAAGRTLKNTAAVAAPSIAEAMRMMLSGEADAFALSRDSLPPFVAQLPGSRIVEGGFQQTGVAVAVPPGRPQALAAATAWMARAKSDGTVRRALDAAGFPGEPVAP